jgi:AraC-like DNA-binding protein
MARGAKGQGVEIAIGADLKDFLSQLNNAKAASKQAGAEIANIFKGSLGFEKTMNQVDRLAASMLKTKAAAQALDADFSKAQASLEAVARAAGLSEKQFAGLARQMAQKTNLDILERNLNNIQRMTGASALQMAKLRAEAGDTIGAIRGLGQAASTSIGNILTLKNVIVAGIVGQGFREFARVTSVMTDLDSRLKQATGSAQEAAAAFARIYETAKRSYANFENTAEIFLSNSVALKDLGYSTKQQLDLMESLTAALVVSGAKGQQAETVINALAKALMEGELKGRPPGPRRRVALRPF